LYNAFIGPLMWSGACPYTVQLAVSAIANIEVENRVIVASNG
jgi:hypothetical protein